MGRNGGQKRSAGGVPLLVVWLFGGAICRADVFDVYIAAGQSNMERRGRNREQTGSSASSCQPQRHGVVDAIDDTIWRDASGQSTGTAASSAASSDSLKS